MKIKSCAHQEFNNPNVLANVESNMNNNRDVLGRREGYNTFNSSLEEFYFDKLKVVEMDGYFPNNMIKLIEEKFPYLIKQL
jgi:hypothetical protein